MTKVIFRKYKDGDIIALFPCDPGTNDPITCQSYMRLGQHSSAYYYGVIKDTKQATPKEYESLHKELVSIGYDDLKIYHKSGHKDLQTRLDQIRQAGNGGNLKK